MSNPKEIIHQIQSKLWKSPNILDTDIFPGANHTLCLDGVSCTKKTTILAQSVVESNNREQQHQHHQVIKTQQLHHFVNADCYFPSMLGYVCTGLQSLNAGGPHFNDRSPLNVIEWHILWRCMGDFSHRYGNVRPNNDAHEESMSLYRTIFETLRQADFYKSMRSKINCIVLIDSDLNRCDRLHAKRNEGSDMERSKWLFYTPLQNLMYQTLYPEAHFDWATLPDKNHSDMIDFLANTLNTVVDALAYRIGSISLGDENQKNGTGPKMTRDTIPLPIGSLPVSSQDLYLMNYTTHLYRSTGKVVSRRIHHKYRPYSRSAFDGETMRDIFKNHIPRHLAVLNPLDVLTGRDDVLNDTRNTKPILPPKQFDESFFAGGSQMSERIFEMKR